MARDQVRIGDVAKAANVSITTVSHSLNGIGQVSPETRQRVQEAAARLGYRPNRIASALRSRRTQTIGFISDQVGTSPYAGDLLLGAQRAAREHGQVLMAVTSGADPALEHDQIRALLQHQVDGVIYARMFHQVVDLPPELAAVPTVVVNAREGSDRAPWVVPDEVGIARVAVERLLAAGHRRIGFAQNDEDIPATHGREQGYREALLAAGIEARDDLVVRASHRPSSGYVAGRALLDRDDPATAIFCFSDRVAMGVYQAAAELGVAVGSGVSVVGVDNLEFLAPDMRPGLTTVELPHTEMGRWGVETLSHLIAGETVLEVDARVRWKCRLIERASVATRPRAL